VNTDKSGAAIATKKQRAASGQFATNDYFCIKLPQKPMKVSIIVPVYCAERDIAECAESLLSQTHADTEYIFVDDCSPDRSVGLLREVVSLHPERAGSVVMLRNKRNLGSGLTRDVALKSATGDYVMFVDSDDILPPKAVQTLHDALCATDADFVEGATRVMRRDATLSVKPVVVSDDVTYRRLLLCQNIVQHSLWGKLFRRRLFADHDLRFAPDVTNFEDYCMMARLALHARRATIDDEVYVYRNTGDSFFSHNTHNFESFCRGNKVVSRYYEQHDPSHRYSAALQVGLLRMMAEARAHEGGLAYVDSIMKPHFTFPLSVCAWLTREVLPARSAYKAYLMARRLYTTVCGLRFKKH